MIVGVKSMEVMGSVKSVTNGDEDAKENGDGVKGVLQVLEAGWSGKSWLGSMESTKEPEESRKSQPWSGNRWREEEEDKRIS
jgi:hypothetical protein